MQEWQANTDSFNCYIALKIWSFLKPFLTNNINIIITFNK